MLHHLLRGQLALLCMLTIGWAAHAQCDDPITFDTDLSDYSVECLSDLPTSCDETVGANRGDVSCILGEQRLESNHMFPGRLTEDHKHVLLVAIEPPPIAIYYFFKHDIT